MSNDLVTANELLDLADAVSDLAAKAEKSLQLVVKERLEALLPNIIDAAKNAALRAVQDSRAAQMPSKPEGG